MVSSHARLIIAASLSSALSCHALHAQAPALPPASFDIMDATIDGIHAAMKSGSLSCVALVENYLARIKAYDQAGPKLNAIQNVNPTAVAMAGEFDAKLKSGGPLGRLHCIPVLVKDQIETNFMPTTYGSALFKTFVPSRNATIVEKMLAEGAIILAKTNLGEFAAGGAGSAFGDMAEVIARWVRNDLGAALAALESSPVAITNGGSYNCRGRNNDASAKISEHGRGNAFDLGPIKLADGTVLES